MKTDIIILNNKNLKMKKIKTAILTGATGYIGKHVTKHLLLDGWRVIHLLRKRKNKKIWNDKVKCYNIKNTFTNSRILKKLNKKNTIFIHLASHSSIKDEVKNCQNYINSNISLGTKLLSFMQKNSFNKLITSETYWQFNQKGEFFGNCLYSETKNCFSIIAKYFHRKYNFSVHCLVLYDVYGPDDNRRKILNMIIDSYKNKSILKLTPGKQFVDYTFIDDVAMAFVVAANKMLLVNKNKFIRNTVRSMNEKKFKVYIKIAQEVLNLKFKIKWNGKNYPKHQIMKPWLPSSKWLLKSWSTKKNFEYHIKKFMIK